jgi:hypothetical protein
MGELQRMQQLTPCGAVRLRAADVGTYSASMQCKQHVPCGQMRRSYHLARTRPPCTMCAGYVDQTIYDGAIGAGWGWQPYYQRYSRLAEEGKGLGGGAATCVGLTKGGGLAFTCKECHRPGAASKGLAGELL